MLSGKRANEVDYGRQDFDSSVAMKNRRNRQHGQGLIQRSLRDSEGSELSPGQQEFFKDSKVRDADGNLLVYKNPGKQQSVLYEGQTHSMSVDALLNDSGISANMSEMQIRQAYSIGEGVQKAKAIKLHEENTKKANGKKGHKPGTVTYNDTYKGVGTVTGVSVGIKDLSGLLSQEVNEKAGRKIYRVLTGIAQATGINIVLYKSEADVAKRFTSAEGSFVWDENTIYLDINAGINNLSEIDDVSRYTVLRTFSHEFTHFIEKWNPIQYLEFRKAVFAAMNEKLAERTANGETPLTVDDLIQQKLERYSEVDSTFTKEKASREVMAEAMTDVLPDSNFIKNLHDNHQNIFKQLKIKLEEFLADIKSVFEGHSKETSKNEADLLKEEGKYIQSIVDMFDKAAAEAVENYQKAYAVDDVVMADKNPGKQQSVLYEGQVQYSIRDIVGDSGNHYGKGVYLDSTLLDNLTDEERIEMVKLYIKDELAGKVITAFDKYGSAHDIKIAEHKKFKNKNGGRSYANNDLTGYITDNDIKQQALANVEELILAASFIGTEPATHPHGWLDNNGNNDWDLWKVHIQEKNKTIWTASLRIANTANGEKVLYDIFPIEKVEGVGTSTTLSTDGTIPQSNGKSQAQNQLRESSLSDADILVIAAEAVKNNDAKYNWLNDGDKAALDIFMKRAATLREAQAKRMELLAQKNALMNGREAKEITGDEKAELRKVQNNLDTVNGQIKRAEEELVKVENQKVIKKILKQARTVVEKDSKARWLDKLQADKNKRSTTAMRHNIKEIVNELNGYLLKGTKDKHGDHY